MSGPEITPANETLADCCGGHDAPAASRVPAETPGTTRRTVLAAAGAVGAAGVLAACTSSSDSTDATPSSAGDASGQPDPVTDVPTTSPALVAAADVPVGGATFVVSKGIVVAQPSEGEFKAFDARCPHQGCMVSNTQGSDLLCPCHASLFSSQTGDVVRGPATRGLDEVSIDVQDGQIVTT